MFEPKRGKIGTKRNATTNVEARSTNVLQDRPQAVLFC